MRPDPFVGIWPRGGAKSTSAEAACVALGARRKRRYGWYISGTQDQADEHVANVAAILESPALEFFYPDMASRAVGKYGNSKGWRRNRLRTAAGFTIDAVGLDTASRGVKVEDQRPDFMVIDDVDDVEDTIATVRRKIRALTRSLFPAGAPDLAILAIQNVIHPEGIFARLADGRADFLATRIVSGPIPALLGFRIEAGVIHGTPTWPEGQSLETCRDQAADWGMAAFVAEAQHDVTHVEGALWTRAAIDASRVETAPELVKVVVGVDPAVTCTPDSDDTGIVAVGLGIDGHAYVLRDASCHVPVEEWARRVVNVYDDLEADEIAAEQNQGYDLVNANIHSADSTVPIEKVRAKRGKATRAQPVRTLYGDIEAGQLPVVHHVGVFPELEDELCTWNPGSGADSPDRLDALVWAVWRLLIEPHSGRRSVWR